MSYTNDKKFQLADEDELTSRQKAAILMVALGEEAAGEIMKYLADFEIEDMTHVITELKSLPNDIQDRVLEEFEQHLLAGEWVNQGGVDFARAALERAVGPRRAQEILDRVTTNTNSGFYMLKNVAPEQIAPFISNEHPQTIALILSQLEPNQAAGILSQLPESVQAEVAYRIATLDNITPSVLKQIEESLEINLKDILGGHKDVGGPKVVADMLNLTGGSVEKSVLDKLDAQDPEVAETVRNMMFVFDDLHMLTDREIQIILREVEQKDLVVALKTASEEVKNKILDNMSERVRAFVEEEMDFLGPMRLSEVEEVQLRVVQKVRQLEEQGQVTIIRGAAEDTFV
jgi:flagellar motor switch protein FliG